MSMLLIGFLCALLGSVNTPPGSVSVEEFGAVPNDSVCDAKAIQQAFDYARKNGIDTVLFEAGDYYLADPVPDRKNFEDERFSSYVLVSGSPGLTVLGKTDNQGNPATRLVKYNPCLNHVALPGHLQFDDCPNLTVKNLVFDNKPQYASAGEVSRISGDSVFVEVLEGLPVVDGMAAYCMNVWDLKTRDLKHQESLTYGAEKEINKKNAYWHQTSEKDGNVMVMTSSFIAEKIQPGDGLSWHFGARTTFQLAINRCDDLVLENILTPNTSGFGIQTSACKNITSKHVIFKSTNNQLAVGPRDAWKVHMGDGIVDVDSLYIEGVRWDGQNVHGTFLVFQEQLSNKKFRVWKKYATLRPFENDSIGFWIDDQEYTRFVTGYTIEKQTDKECVVTITVDEPLPKGVKNGTYVSVHRWDNDHYILRNSTFRNVAGCASIIKNRKVTLENNVYDNIMYPALALGGEIETHFEGTFPEDVLVRNCTFSSSGWVSRLGTKGLVGIGNHGYDGKVIGSIRFVESTFNNADVGVDILSAKKVSFDQCTFNQVKQPYRVKDQTTTVEKR